MEEALNLILQKHLQEHTGRGHGHRWVVQSFMGTQAPTVFFPLGLADSGGQGSLSSEYSLESPERAVACPTLAQKPDMCVSTCSHVCISAASVCTSTCVCICVGVSVRGRVSMCVCVCLCSCPRVFMSICVRACLYMSVHVYVCLWGCGCACQGPAWEVRSISSIALQLRVWILELPTLNLIPP